MPEAKAVPPIEEVASTVPATTAAAPRCQPADNARRRRPGPLGMDRTLSNIVVPPGPP